MLERINPKAQLKCLSVAEIGQAPLMRFRCCVRTWALEALRKEQEPKS